jgi:hypothetical protein
MGRTPCQGLSAALVWRRPRGEDIQRRWTGLEFECDETRRVSPSTRILSHSEGGEERGWEGGRIRVSCGTDGASVVTGEHPLYFVYTLYIMLYIYT